MKEKTIFKNILYSLLVQISSIIVPLITSPYIARVFNADLIGQYSYTLANSNYFAMFETLGLTLYGMIEIAKVKNDKFERSKIFWEISLIKLFLTIICSISYIFTFIFYKSSDDRLFYIIMLMNLLSVGMDTTWFLNGLEDFKTTALRNIFVRIANVILIFTLIKSPNDILLYSIIMQGSTLASYFTILPSVKKQICFVNISSLSFKRYFRPALVYFVPGFITTLFSSADKTILGMFSSNYEVGIYEQASKICTLLSSVISGISNVLLPRAAYLSNASESNEESIKLFRNSIRVACLGGLAICIGVEAISNVFVRVFFGEGYDKSSIILQILCINVFFVSISNFYGQQALMARGKQKEYNISICAAVIINLIGNLVLVKNYESVGVSIASAASAIVEFIFIYSYGKDMLTLKEMMGYIWKYVLAAMVMYFVVINVQFSNEFASLIAKILTGAFTYFFCLLILKDEFVSFILNRRKKKYR